MLDMLDELSVDLVTLGRRTIWTSAYRNAEIAVVAEHDLQADAIWHRVFVREADGHHVVLGTEPPRPVYKTLEAAGEAGLRRAMAYLDRAPIDGRTAAQF